MADKRRVYRVAEKIREVVSRELMQVADPRLTFITITSVVLAPDLRHAKIYWNALGDATRIAEVTGALKGALGHFRSVVSQALDMRFAPTLAFYYDDTMDTVDEVNRLLGKVAKDTESGERE